MDPHDYFKEFVRPNFEEFRADPTSRRLAVNAAVSVSHMADCVGVKEGLEAPKVRAAVAQRCPQFNIVADVADAYKHITIGAIKSGRARDFKDFVRVEVYHRAPYDDNMYYDDGTGYEKDPLTVTVSADNKGRHDLISCLERAIAYWQDYLTTGQL